MGYTLLNTMQVQVSFYLLISVFFKSPFPEDFPVPQAETVSEPLTSLHVSFTDAASLYYTYTVNKSGSGPWKQEVKGQVDEHTFIYCGSTNNCQAIGLIGKKLNVTKTWDLQCDTLKDGLGQVTDQALLMKPENDTVRGEFQMAP